MKRPITVAGFTLLTTLSAAFYFGERFAFVLGIVSLLLFAFFAIIKSTRKTALTLCFLTAFLSCLYFSLYTGFVYKPVTENYSDKEIKITGYVTDSYKNYSTYVYKLKTDTINGKEESAKIILRSGGEMRISPYSEFSGSLMVRKNNYKNDISSGYYLVSYGYGEGIRETGEKHKGVFYLAYLAKTKFKNAFYDLYNDDVAAFMSTAVLGEKYEMDSSVKNDFRTAGVSYMIVVSGMHLSMFVSIISFLLKGFKKRSFTYTVQILFILFYMTLTGFSFSIVRSGIMFLIYIAGNMLMRESDSLNSLGLAAFMVTVNPYFAGDIGLLLSFAATLGIILLQTPLENCIVSKFTFKRRLPNIFFKALVSLFTLSVSAVIFTLPLTMISFSYSSTLQVLYGIFVSPVLTIVLFCAVFTLIFYFIPFASVFCYPFAFVGGICAKFILCAVSASKYIPFATIGNDKLYVYLWLGISLILAGVLVLLGDMKKYAPYFAAASAVLFIFSSAFSYIGEQNSSYITAYNSGSGITVTVHSGGRKGVLYAKGEDAYSYSVLDSIKYTGGQLSFMSVPDMYGYANSYAKSIESGFDFEELLLYDKSKISDFDGKLCVLEDGYKLDFNGIKIEYFKTSSYSYSIFVSSGRETALILPEGADCSSLPKRCLHPGAVIAEGRCLGEDLVTTELLIICGNRYNAGDLARQLRFNRKTAAFTCEGDFRLNLEA